MQARGGHTSLKHKSSSARGGALSSNQSVHYYIEDSVLVIDSNQGSNSQANMNSTLDKTYEKYFIAGVRKHVEVKAQLERTFTNLGL